MNSIYNAFYLAIVLGFLRDTSRKVSSSAPRFRSIPKTVVHTVLLRPTPPGPLPIAACAGYHTAAEVARRLNSLNLPNCRFAAMYPEFKYEDRAEHHVRQHKVCPLYENTMKLPDSTQSALYDAFSAIDPNRLLC